MNKHKLELHSKKISDFIHLIICCAMKSDYYCRWNMYLLINNAVPKFEFDTKLLNKYGKYIRDCIQD